MQNYAKYIIFANSKMKLFVYMNIKAYILLIFSVLVFFGCSTDKDDEDKIGLCIEKFYQAINKSDFKTAESLCSNNMKPLIKKLKESDMQLINYKKLTIKDISITSERACVVVEIVDEFSNQTQNTWDLIRTNDDWKINNYNFSYASPLPSPVKANNNNILTTKDTLLNVDSTQDTIYN